MFLDYTDWLAMITTIWYDDYSRIISFNWCSWDRFA